jgi:2-dehydropantoate 2-reductase
MRICIIGAGAIGGTLAAKLLAAGEETSVLARGRTLEALRRRGLTLRSGGTAVTMRPRASAAAAELGRQDCVIVAVKAQDTAEAVAGIGPLLGPETVVLPAVNGIPWWYFHHAGGAFDGSTIDSVDPGGRIARAIGAERVIGCVVYLAASVREPAVIDHTGGEGLVLGEPDGTATARLESVAGALRRAGFATETTADIRGALWGKLWGNLCFNPLSALTGATMGALCADPATRSVLRTMMEEGQRVGEAFGIRFPMAIEKRLEMAAALGAFKTSMLQDFEAGRPLELDAILGAVLELARRAAVLTPLLDSVYALARQRAITAGCYRPPA